MVARRRMWSEFTWPDWVPVKVQGEVESFWDDRIGRGPDQWEANARDVYNHAPPFGELVRMRRMLGRPSEGFVVGRYVHAWNNIGRLVLEDGTVAHVSSAPGSWALESEPTTLHVSVDVRGLLHRNNRELRRYLSIPIGGRTLTTAYTFRDALIDQLAKGREVLPVGDACEGFDYKRGCPGHLAPRSTP
jgi:hypothetical protein